MRLQSVKREIPLSLRLLFGLTGLFGADVPMARTVAHRTELLGGPFAALLQAAMRGESPWSPFERELFASFTSSIEQCPY